MTDEELKKLDAVCDKPSRYDYEWSEYVEGDSESKKIADKVKIKVRDQYDQKETYKACSAYGLTAIYNGYQWTEFNNGGLEFEQENPRWKWEAFQATRNYPDKGASLQDMMEFFRKRGLIDGYVRCKTVQECKNAINNGYLIYTGSGKCSWSKTSKAKEFVYDENGANHCFAIVDCDDSGFIAINSFGEDWGDKGYFHINYDNYGSLFTTYAIIDHDDKGKLEELKYKMEYEKAIELGITNGTRPDDNMTRREGAVMVYRAFKLLNK